MSCAESANAGYVYGSAAGMLSKSATKVSGSYLNNLMAPNTTWGYRVVLDMFVPSRMWAISQQCQSRCNRMDLAKDSDHGECFSPVNIGCVGRRHEDASAPDD